MMNIHDGNSVARQVHFMIKEMICNYLVLAATFPCTVDFLVGTLFIEKHLKSIKVLSAFNNKCFGTKQILAKNSTVPFG